MRDFKPTSLLGCVAMAMALTPFAANAADNVPFTIDEIVVTAQKRSELLQDVPIAITAIPMDRIEKMGAVSFTDYARTVPGLSFIDRGPGRSSITIRGITTGADQGKQALVGVYFDDMAVSAPSFQPDLNLFDIEQIEILRGPQGTLYGAGSMGGALKLTSAKPDATALAAKVDATLSSTRYGGENYVLNAMVNAPIVDDKLALRIVGYYRDYSGYIDNVTLNRKNVNDEETYGGRVALRATPTENLTITAMAMFQDTKVGGTQEANLLLGELVQNRSIVEERNDKFQQYNLTIDWDIGGAELTSSTTYFDRDFAEDRDVSAILGAPSIQANALPIKTFTQEFRLTSTGDGPLKWLVGAYYTHQKDRLLQLVSFAPPIDMLLLDNNIGNKLEQIAFFGEATYDITPRFHATVGLRWFSVDQTYSRFATGPIVGGTDSGIGDASVTKINPKFGLSFDITDDALLFVQASQGFRVGGPNSTLPPDLDGTVTPSQYGPDTLWNYEIGLKTSWLNNRLVANASLFYIDWTDIQVVTFRQDGFSYIGNAGEASSKGAELELTAYPIEGLELRGAFSYTDAQLEKNVPGIGGAKGDRIPLVPRYTWSGSARYSFPVSDNLGGFAQFDIQHMGSSYNAFNRAAADLQRSYNIGSLRAGIEADQWQLTVFVDNLWDERADLFLDTLLGDVRANVNRPRTIGVNVRAQF